MLKSAYLALWASKWIPLFGKIYMTDVPGIGNSNHGSDRLIGFQDF